MDGQYHLIRFRAVVQGLVLVAEPDQFLLSVPLADVHAEGDEFPVDHITERIRLGCVGSALDGDRPLVVRIGGRAPGAVFSSTYSPTRPSLSML